jgi:methyltransferase (TIGR00027 family)
MDTKSENIIQTGVPSRSAMRVATVRAVHHLLDDPIILEDPVALPILGAQMAATIQEDPFQFNDPMGRGLRAAMVVRSKLAEDELGKAVEAGVRQYVILGAGLDTFAYRNPYTSKGLHVYEVDHPSTQAWKKTLLQNAHIPVPNELTFVAADFEKKTLAESLREAGFRFDQPAYFSWLGVVVYLTQETIFDTLRFVASLPEGSGITFDYCLQRSLLNPIERAISETLGKVIAELGEPWVSFFEPATLIEDVKKLGFTHINDLGPDELNSRYFFRRKDGLRAGGSVRLMCAKT